MITFFSALVILLLGYWIYGKITEKIFGIDQNLATPAMKLTDGVDFVPMRWPQIFLIQLLNIAGLGPIFGAIAGALWGPVAFIWIVLGCIFAGAVHDFLSGMLSVRHNGASISEIFGIYLGNNIKQFTRIFSVILLILVGTVFVSGPAKLLAVLTPAYMDARFWTLIIIAYYFLATILPIDKLIGRIYPIFGLILFVMVLGIGGGIILEGYHIPELNFTNLHPKKLPIWPLMFITIACGAISGFHATQSPMMARCLKNERHGRQVFYGAMIAEGVIALIWAAAAIAFFGSTAKLNEELQAASPGGVVHRISVALLGSTGSIWAMLGVVVCPITSGDTAFRSARLTIADALKINQKKIIKRLMISLPLFAIGYFLTLIDFSIIWRYFAWANQTLAMMVLWACAVYLKRERKIYWIAALPATFMTAVSITYILQAPEGLSLPIKISYPSGIFFGIFAMLMFFYKTKDGIDSTLIEKQSINKIEDYAQR